MREKLLCEKYIYNAKILLRGVYIQKNSVSKLSPPSAKMYNFFQSITKIHNIVNNSNEKLEISIFYFFKLFSILIYYFILRIIIVKWLKLI